MRNSNTAQPETRSPAKTVTRKRRFRATSLGDLTQPLVKKAIGKTMPAMVALMQNWQSIAPAEFQQTTRPVKIKFPRRDSSRDGVLELEVLPEAAFIVQHSTPQLINAIAIYFGYPAVGSVKIKQVAFRDIRDIQSEPDTFFNVTAKPLPGIKDPELAQTLANLAAAVSARSRKKS